MQAPRGSDPRIRKSYKTHQFLPLSCRCSDHMSSQRVEQSPGSTASYSYQGVQHQQHWQQQAPAADPGLSRIAAPVTDPPPQL